MAYILLQRWRSKRGHQGYVSDDGQHRLNILEVQRLIRFMPKVVIAVVQVGL
jgi:naphthoate synthase